MYKGARSYRPAHQSPVNKVLLFIVAVNVILLCGLVWRVPGNNGSSISPLLSERPRVVKKPTLQPLVSVMTVLFKAENFLEGFLKDATRQTAILKGMAELILVSVEQPDTLRAKVQPYLDNHPNIVYLNLVEDPGLYGVWNMIAQYHAQGKYVTNWNVDDRKHPEALEVFVRFLESNPGVDIVSSTITVSKIANESFEENKKEETWWEWLEGVIDISVLFEYDKSGNVVSSFNLPHSSPMWKRSLHTEVGYFDEKTYGVIADWQFWLACLAAGKKYYKLRESYDLYYVNPTSHNRRGSEDKKSAVMRQVARQYTDKPVRIGQLRPSRILVISENSLAWDNEVDLQILQLLKTLKREGHKVTFLQRGKAGGLERLLSVVEEIVPDHMMVQVPDGELGYRKLRNPGLFFRERQFDAAILSTQFIRHLQDNTLAPSIPEEYIPLLTSAHPRPKLAFLAHDIHWVRHVELNQPNLARDLKRREGEVYSKADVIWTGSQGDADFIKAWTGRAAVLLPCAIQPVQSAQRFQQRHGLIILGTYESANADVEWYLSRVLPILKELMPRAPALSIIGSGWQGRSLCFTYEGVACHAEGMVPSLLAEARVFLSPGVSKQSVARRVLLALAHGVPVVMGQRVDSLAVDSVEAPVLVGTTAEELARATVLLYSNNLNWESQSSRGLKHITRFLNQNRQANIVDDIVIYSRTS